jgi:RecA-family ATPase
MTGKTFALIELAACVVLGRPFFDREVTKGPAVIFPLEGGGGLDLRLRTWEGVNGQTLPDTLVVSPDPLDLRTLSDGKKKGLDVQEAIAVCEKIKPVFIAIDTLSHALAGDSDNDPAHMSAVVQNCVEIANRTGAHIMLVHHVGKDREKGPRGSTHLPYDIDTTILAWRPLGPNPL